MLTAELVEVHRRSGELRLAPTDDARRARILALATRFRALAVARVGEPRDAVEEALAEAAADMQGGSPAARRLALAVLKLVKDGCRFEEADAEAAYALRRAVFQRAAAARRQAAVGAGFDDGVRAEVLAAVAAERGATADDVEARLFADRPAVQRLLAVEAEAPAALAAGFPLHEARAVLLRATKLRAEVHARDPRVYRALFRTLKFLRLLPVIRPLATARGCAYAIELDGPLSLFQANARYGLQLGLALVAIAACDSWSLDAELRWPTRRAGRWRDARAGGSATGPDHELLRFRLAGGAVAGEPDPAGSADADPELDTLAAAFEASGDGGWRVDREPAVLDLPGVGLCVPDLAFVRAADGVRVHFERLGFWSREAVWRRVDLVRAGLPHRILFAVSRALRVGEEVLDDAPNAALYVYARTPSVREIRARLEQLAGPSS